MHLPIFHPSLKPNNNRLVFSPPHNQTTRTTAAQATMAALLRHQSITQANTQPSASHVSNRRCARAAAAPRLPLHRSKPCRASSTGNVGSSREPRAIGCPDLYNMTQAINEQQAVSTVTAQPAQQQQQQQLASVQAAAAASTPSSAPPPQPGQQDPAKYYAGLITTDLSEDNGASAADMLKRSLQLAGARWAERGWSTLRSNHRNQPRRSITRLPTTQKVRNRVVNSLPAPTLPHKNSGGIAGLLVLLTVGFLASNGLL